MAGRAVVRSLLANVPMMKGAGYEARQYYNLNGATRRYWEGWCDALDAVVSGGEQEVKDLIMGMGGRERALYIAHGVAEGLRHYEDVVKGDREPLNIATEDFSLFHESKPLNDDDDDTEGGGAVPDGV